MIWDRNLKVRLIGEGLFNLLYWMYFPFIALYFSVQLGSHIAGLLMMAPPMIGMVVGLLSGSLCDRFGRRPIMLFGTVIQTVMFAIFAMSNSYWLDYVAFIGIGIGNSMYRPPSIAMVADLVPDHAKRKVFATFATINNIGAVLGPVFGAIFFFQYRADLLWTCTVFLLLYTVAVYFFIYETVPEKEKLTFSLKETAKAYQIIFRDAVFGLFVFAGVFSVVTIMQLDLYLAVYIINEIPSQVLFSTGEWSLTLTSAEVFGWMLGINGLMFVILILPLTNWLKNWSEKHVFLLSCVFAGGGFFFVGVHENVWYLFAVTIVFTIGEIIRAPVSESFVASYAPQQARGQYIAASNLQFTLGRTLAPITVFLSAWLQPMFIFAVILICSIISAVLYTIMFKLYEKKSSAR